MELKAEVLRRGEKVVLSPGAELTKGPGGAAVNGGAELGFCGDVVLREG